MRRGREGTDKDVIEPAGGYWAQDKGWPRSLESQGLLTNTRIKGLVQWVLGLKTDGWGQMEMERRDKGVCGAPSLHERPVLPLTPCCWRRNLTPNGVVGGTRFHRLHPGCPFTPLWPSFLSPNVEIFISRYIARSKWLICATLQQMVNSHETDTVQLIFSQTSSGPLSHVSREMAFLCGLC